MACAKNISKFDVMYICNTFIRVATMSNKWVHDFSTSIVQRPALKTSGRIVWQMMGPSISRCSCVIPCGTNQEDKQDSTKKHVVIHITFELY